MEHVERRQDVAARHGLSLIAATVKAGIGAGLLGGLAMAAWLMVFTLFTGRGLLTPLKLIGATFYGRAALGPGYGAAFWGTVLHVGVAVALGVLFAAIFHRDITPIAEVAAGIVYALGVWVVMTFVVMPVVDPVMRQAVPGISLAWCYAHVAYGGVLGLAQQLRREVDV